MALTALLSDLRHAGRSLRRAPGFTAVAALTLALGIGASSAIFSVLDGVVLKPLRYPAAERLVIVHSWFRGLGFERFWVSAPEYLEYRQQSTSYQALGAYTTGAVNLGAGDEPMRVRAAWVDRALLAALGAEARPGRLFSAEEDGPGGEPVALIGDALWRRAFAADPAVVQRSVRVDGIPRRVAGVLPAGFDLPDQGIELWLPLALDPAAPPPRNHHDLELIGQLRPGVPLRQARAELTTLLGRWEVEHASFHPLNTTRHGLRLTALQEDVVGGVRPRLVLLLAAVGFVLLIACANVANLLLARAEARQREIALRSALGAGRRRLFGQFFAEGLVLSLLGAALGTLLAGWALRLLLAASPESLPRAAEVALDGRVLAFALGLAVLTAVVFALAPLLHLAGQDLAAALKEGGQRSTAQVSRQRLRGALVVAEVTLAVVLVTGAGLMLRSFWNLLRVDPGFNAEHLLTFQLALNEVDYPQDRDLTAGIARVTERLAALPGVSAVTAMSGLPPRRELDANNVEFEGVPAATDGSGAPPVVDYWQFVQPGFFAALEVPLVEGRGFTAGDAPGAPAVAIVNQTLAELVWPGQSALGKRLRPAWGDTGWLTVVGVARDVKQGGLERPAGTEIYLSYPQAPGAFPFTPRTLWLALRSPLPTASLLPAVRREVRAVDPELPLEQPRRMAEVLGSAVAQPRLVALLVAVFGAVALALAAIGTYGVLAYTVTQRRQEIGVRMALGADARRILALVLRRGMALAGTGLVLGLGAALALTRLAESQLFAVGASDPATFAAVLLLIAAVSLAACLLPALRATRVPPVTALRAG